jgi:fatty-acyl-CoA synthase
VIPAEGRSKAARDAWIRALSRTASIDANPRVILSTVIEALAARFDGAPALVSPGQSLSYRQLAERCRRYARWGLARGFQPGDVVALLMHNCADYPAVWLGLNRIGVSVALINTHLTGDLLAAALASTQPRGLLVGASLAGDFAAIRDRAKTPARAWVLGDSPLDIDSLEPQLSGLPADPLDDAECPTPQFSQTGLYIYTSGTTGLPKAARVSHHRVMQWSHWFAGLMDTGAGDRMYDCLPLYHSIGGVVAIGATLLGGGAVVLRERFSASEFWRDVRTERCTLFQYIGELCRYLVNAPPQTGEQDHALRLACGNGLRPEVWNAFATRFAIPRILEYYASTEGNFSLYNCEGEPGAIGRIPPFLRHRLPVELVLYDVQSGEPRRDAAGRCRRCEDGEIGEAIGMIPAEGGTRAGRFEGYADADATNAKILRNVFQEGDAWYRTGDLMRRDARGFFFFVDRVGDTYRWKGENVSTAEVQSVLATLPGVVDAVVYGVPVAGADGRAGMAALVVTADFDLGAFRAALAPRLPAYARPVFLRLIAGFETTATFKPVKQRLIGDGFDPGVVRDPLWLDLPAAGAYVPIDAALFAGLEAAAVRL